jgi:glycosyltransferase involved in cell wall biosynthesis
MNTIHVRITAYNAEKTLRRAIDSVLAQTYKNYVIYVCDNGSEDGTRSIVDEYAERGLIIPYYNEKNRVFEGKSIEFRDLRFNIPDEDFFASLDSDDEIYPENFEKLINFALENDLDIAMAGYDLFNMQNDTKDVYQHFANNKKQIILETPEDYLENFKTLYLYSWAVWGKLFRGSISRELDHPLISFRMYGDTASVLSAIMKARRVGVLPEQLLCYYIGNDKSITRSHDKTRIYAPEALFKIVCELLYEKLKITEPDDFTTVFAYSLFFSKVAETIAYSLSADISEDEKFSELKHMINCETNREFYRSVNYFDIVTYKDEAFDVFGLPLAWIMANQKKISPKYLCDTYHLFFDVIFQSKEPKFIIEEIDFLLQYDLRVINSILCGAFEAPRNWLLKLPESELRNSVLEKVGKYL